MAFEVEADVVEDQLGPGVVAPVAGVVVAVVLLRLPFGEGLVEPVALTRRDKPQAMLIPMGRWEAAVNDAEIRPLYDRLVADLRQAVQDPEFAGVFERKLPRWHELLDNDAL